MCQLTARPGSWLSSMTFVAVFGLLSACGSTAASSADGFKRSPVELDSCPKAVPAPWTGSLTIESKYDQSDASKSTLRKRSAESDALQRQISEFSKGLVRFGDYAIEKAGTRKGDVALACLSGWLHEWADANALLSSDATKTGVAVRKWTLAAISSVLLKTDRVLPGQLPADPRRETWLLALADRVIGEYDSRLDASFKYFNNHDYWAAWAIASTGLLLNREDYLRWADARLKRAISQLEMAPDSDIAWLPNEIAREQLAANYINYALVPLVMLESTLPEAGYPLTGDEQKRFSALVNFAALIELEPSSLSTVLDDGQESVPDYKMVWLIPWLNGHPQHALARRLYNDRDGDVDGYSQAGGKLAPWFGSPEEKTP